MSPFKQFDPRFIPYDETIVHSYDIGDPTSLCNYSLNYTYLDDDPITALEYSWAIDRSCYITSSDKIIFPRHVNQHAILDMVNGLKYLDFCSRRQLLSDDTIPILRRQFLNWHSMGIICWKLLTCFYDYDSFQSVRDFYPDSVQMFYPNTEQFSHNLNEIHYFNYREYLAYIVNIHDGDDYDDRRDYIIKVWCTSTGHFLVFDLKQSQFIC